MAQENIDSKRIFVDVPHFIRVEPVIGSSFENNGRKEINNARINICIFKDGNEGDQ